MNARDHTRKPTAEPAASPKDREIPDPLREPGVEDVVEAFARAFAQDLKSKLGDKNREHPTGEEIDGNSNAKTRNQKQSAKQPLRPIVGEDPRVLREPSADDIVEAFARGFAQDLKSILGDKNMERPTRK